LLLSFGVGLCCFRVGVDAVANFHRELNDATVWLALPALGVRPWLSWKRGIEMRVVIVGATGGIGRALSRQLVEAGDQVFAIGRREDALEQWRSEFGGGIARADAADWDELERAYQQAVLNLTGVDGVVCLAGSVLLKPAHLTSPSDWQATIAQNLTTAFGVIRAATKSGSVAGGDQAGRGLSIVLMSSAAASIGLSNHEAIAAAKGGIEGLVRSAAATYAARRIRVNAIAPGLTQTPMTERIWSNPRSAEASRSLHPLGCLGDPSQVAQAIEFLLSERASWITGQVLGVDGGLSRLKVPAPPAPGNPG
jgi:NAD(P)-dependent dehydrogenase (short-subunit alcohol dehydrogenase family)